MGGTRTRASRCITLGALSICLVLAGAVEPLPAAETATARPNVIMIVADDLGWGDLGCYGNPDLDTPVLDRLARTGVRLTACYSPSPLC